ncbi:uncharacterized protein B0I36DRAFT_54040 [Microdochium trichocladiopsis]|uniref:Uncharacterized protein n=1 Tax=Microdochium trichocladiopsis TaxID=1682393 RepID=A0A9P8XSB0_9PEZI|nr:uncharacterized protein B0I36DRAFT_54040 [Microdochium trichocladiopsis]KAH7012050.1 hypothetical protein B0I36DRAFT_54040 [Microdochium trichocladiopsis]
MNDLNETGAELQLSDVSIVVSALFKDEDSIDATTDNFKDTGADSWNSDDNTNISYLSGDENSINVTTFKPGRYFVPFHDSRSAQDGEHSGRLYVVLKKGNTGCSAGQDTDEQFAHATFVARFTRYTPEPSAESSQLVTPILYVHPITRTVTGERLHDEGKIILPNIQLMENCLSGKADEELGETYILNTEQYQALQKLVDTLTNDINDLLMICEHPNAWADTKRLILDKGVLRSWWSQGTVPLLG